MTRCDNEGVFYRVFCVGLLIIAFTFTVILTNVFIDIDGLLSKKERESSVNQASGHVTEVYERTSDPREYYVGERNYDGNSAFRTKRSLDTPDFLLHIKNPKMKSILTHRLATLLEELDEEEGTVLKKENDKVQDSNDIYVKTDNNKAKEVKVVDASEKKNNEEMLHMAMHNILLKGVIGHTDLSEVYKKVHTLVRTFKHKERMVKDNDLLTAIEDENEATAKSATIQPTTPLNEEDKFFEELVKCTKLQQEIIEASTVKASTQTTKKVTEVSINRNNIASPKFLIKTLIDIQKNDKELDKNSKENIKGIIKLIYNGKSIKIKSMDDEEITTVAKPTTLETTTTTTTTVNRDVEIISDILKQNFGGRDIPKSYVNSVLIEYLSKYKKKSQTEQPIKYTEKRLKRNIKFGHTKDTKRFRKPVKKKDDDELYVEIETHFDDKGMKGKKKKELIKQLIEKIQKAIHSNQEIVNQKKPVKDVRNQEMHIRKRTQSSLAHKNDTQPSFINKDDKNIISYDANMYREQAPISKVSPVSKPLTRVSDENGQDWRKKEVGPKFFSTSKSINSAELSQVDVDFSKVMTLTGVPQRLQVPLNTDTNVSDESPNAYLDLGNLQFMIKDIEGSGFSIGLNQYVDHAPDPESIKLFTGLENLVNTYHQTYDQNNPDYSRQGIAVLKHEMKKRDIEISKLDGIKVNEDKDKHAINKRSTDIQGADYHSNEYKIIFDDKFLPYDNYQEIYEHKQKKVSLPVLKIRKKVDSEANEKKTEITSDLDSIFNQKLKPSEIFDLANFLDRKKRSHSVQKIMNLNTKIRLNRFINTKAMPKQKFFLKSKRNKRQIGKIRIIAKDMKGQSDSDENIFIVSDENMYADRAVVRHTDVAESQEDKAEDTGDNEPLVFEEKPKVFAVEDYVRHNTLMSKYPHVFVEEADDGIPTPIPAELGKAFVNPNNRKTATEVFNDPDGVMEGRMPKVQDLVHALVPYPKANYKVTVKLLPKDENDTRSGFKEVHTSINKTFNKNGLLYSSLVNVSEISKIEAANGTNDSNLPNGFIDALQTIGLPYHEMKSFEHHNNKNNDVHLRIATTPAVVQTKHDELTRLLQAQKESIDSHFNNLRNKIQKITKPKTEAPIEAKKDLMDILASSQPDALQMNKDYISELLCQHLKEKEKEKDTTTTTTTATTTTTTTTTTTVKPEVVEALKVKLLSAISQNERLTSRILNKIDQNTDILQTFLTKITDKMQSIPELTKVLTKQINEDNHEHNVNAHPVFMRQPNNNTDVPFIYAYKPCRPTTKVESPVASIVYNEGIPKTTHKNEIIHNHLPDANKKDFDFETLIQKDNTRYFIDEDYFKTFALPNKPGEDVKKDDQLKMIDKSPMVMPGIPGIPVDHNIVQPMNNNNNVIPFRYKSNAPAPKPNYNMTKVM